jgi:DedD protein
LAQDEYYYEIQLTNKQLVFYFMAGASGLVLSFLAGIMVGRGVDATAEVQAASRPAYEDKIISEEPPSAAAKATAAPAAEELNYSRRLESDKAEDAAAKPKTAANKPEPPAPVRATSAPAATAAPVVATTAPAKASAAPTSAPKTLPSTGTRAAAPTAAPVKSVPPAAALASGFAIQVGAFKDKVSADSLVGRLKKKSFPAYVVTPDGADGGLFNVRVGSFPARTEAEKVQARLRVEEKFDPFIVKQ